MSWSSEEPTQAGGSSVVAGSTPGAAERYRPEPRPGDAIDRYIVLGVLGVGGMGVVVHAYDGKLDRKVAIKLLRGGVGERSRNRLLREARALAQLNHPNVVTVHDVGEHDGQVFVAMEFVAGRTLRRWREEARPSVAAVLDVFGRAGRGLAAAHAAGLVHRDFKPDNVMVADDGRVLVMDFGLARGTHTASKGSGSASRTDAAVPLDAELTAAGEVLGTPAYMSPEQWACAAADERSDQFSFCVALYEALYGVRPFSGSNALVASKVAVGNVDAAPAASSVRPHLRAVLVRGLRPRPEDRWPSIEALLEALADDPTRRRKRWLLAGAGSAAVLAIGLWWGGSDGRQRRACDEAGAAIAATYDTAVAERLRQRFVESDVVDAQAQWQRTAPPLARYAEAWHEARRQVCEDAQLTRTRSSLEAERATHCLEVRREALGRLIVALEHADATTVANSASAATSLPRIAACTEYARLALEPAEPTAPERRAQLAELRSELSRAHTLAALGKPGESLAVLDGLHERVAALDWAPLKAEVDDERGIQLHSLGKLDAAMASLTEAFFVGGSNGHDKVAVEAGIRLVGLVGESAGDVERGRQWARFTRMLLDRMEHADPLTRAALDENEALLLMRHGELDEARKLLEAAVNINREVRGPEHHEVATVESHLAIVYADLGEHEAAERLYLHALPIMIAEQGEEHIHVAATRTNYGAVLRALDRADEARQMLTAALAAFERELGPEHPHVASVLVNIAAIDMSARDFDAALPGFQRALPMLRRTLGAEHPMVGSALIGYGTLLRELGRTDEAKDAHEEALALFERNDVQHPDLATLNYEAAQTFADTDPARAHRLATAARAQLADTDPEQAAQVDAWLAAHPTSP